MKFNDLDMPHILTLATVQNCCSTSLPWLGMAPCWHVWRRSSDIEVASSSLTIEVISIDELRAMMSASGPLASVVPEGKTAEEVLKEVDLSQDHQSSVEAVCITFTFPSNCNKCARRLTQ
eukprot:511047-Amphidinium_carterae.2